MKEYRKNQTKNVLKKIKENNELRSIEVDTVTKFIKDEVESSSDVDTDDGDDEQDRSLDSDKICVTSYAIFSSRCCRTLAHYKPSVKMIFFSYYEYNNIII